MSMLVVFGEPKSLPATRDAKEYLYPFTVVDTEFIGKPEELSQTSSHKVQVGVTGTQFACWGVREALLPKVLFEYGKRYIEQKILDGTLSEHEELQLHTGNSESPCPFSPDRIPNPSGHRFKLDLPEVTFMENDSLNTIASNIIGVRDNINAIFHDSHGEKLIRLGEERDLLQLFRDAESIEEFFFRICALANLATNLNTVLLRKLTEDNDTGKKSLSLLETYLSMRNSSDAKIIKTLRAINRIRQSYPVHGDRVDGVLEAHQYFNLDYPVRNFRESWKAILLLYLDALERLLSVIKEK